MASPWRACADLPRPHFSLRFASPPPRACAGAVNYCAPVVGTAKALPSRGQLNQRVLVLIGGLCICPSFSPLAPGAGPLPSTFLFLAGWLQGEQFREGWDTEPEGVVLNSHLFFVCPAVSRTMGRDNSFPLQDARQWPTEINVCVSGRPVSHGTGCGSCVSLDCNPWGQGIRPGYNVSCQSMTSEGWDLVWLSCLTTRLLPMRAETRPGSIPVRPMSWDLLWSTISYGSQRGQGTSFQVSLWPYIHVLK